MNWGCRSVAKKRAMVVPLVVTNSFERETVNGEKSHGGEGEAEAEVSGETAQSVSALRKIPRFPEKVRRLQNLLQRPRVVGLHPRRAQGELVTIHFYTSSPNCSELRALVGIR